MATPDPKLMFQNKESILKKEWTLTQTAFSQLLSQFSDNEEVASEQYLILQRNLIRFFETRSVPNADQATDEVFNRITKKIEEGEVIEKMSSYALTVARFVALEIFKKPKLTELPEGFEEKISYTINEVDDEQDILLARLEKCLSSLPSENKQLVLQYYDGETHHKIENRRQIAKTLGLQQNALTKKITRLREKLEKCLSKKE